MEHGRTGYVHSLETFGLVDGPGVRTVVFLQGCRMRCQYCHNPETWSMTGGEQWTAKALFEKVYRYRNYWKNNGGITVSGGEPLLQIDFLTEFFTLAKKKGVHTTLDTSGNPFTREEPFFGKFQELLKVTDLVMLDLKEMDPVRHRGLTGCENSNILDMARCISDSGTDMWIRRVLVPGLTDQEEDLTALREFVQSL
ncbi:MAG: pyruvate formate-lyase-activating protein, partial [Eubacteriales bacterium]|nr:pyruvate formate-lyase-activating protein [Eubacteriales bacterium]